MTRTRRAAAEALATAGLLVAVIGSGIMGERLSGGNAALTLLANALATGCALYVLILVFGPISGAHMNPLVTLFEPRRSLRDAIAMIAAQLVGAFAGVAAANLMFGLPAWSASSHVRTGPALWLSEAIATFGLILLVLVLGRRRSPAMPLAVAAYITGAYWFTSSTSFANPAVTLARAASDTFAGIRPVDVPGFLGAQLVGAALAAWTSGRLPDQEAA